MEATSNLYVTATEFTNYPTGLDLQNLIPDGTTQENAAELGVMVDLACSYVEQITYQPLYAQAITETSQARAGAYGRLTVRLKRFPVQAVTAAQWSCSPLAGWNAIPTANIQIVGDLAHTYVAVGGGWGCGVLTVMSQYVAGYPNALLTTQASAGATTLQVDDTTGMAGTSTVGTLAVPATELVIYDAAGGGQEAVTVDSVSGNTVTLTSPLLYAHAVGIRVSALPPAVTQAAILLCAYAIKGRRAGGGFVMAGELQPGTVTGTEETENAMELLRPYRRVL